MGRRYNRVQWQNYPRRAGASNDRNRQKPKNDQENSSNRCFLIPVEHFRATYDLLAQMNSFYGFYGKNPERKFPVIDKNTPNSQIGIDALVGAVAEEMNFLKQGIGRLKKSKEASQGAYSQIREVLEGIRRTYPTIREEIEASHPFL